MPESSSETPAPSEILPALMEVIAERKRRPPEDPSYVVKLMAGGVAKIGSKITEEAAEVVEAADEPGEQGRTHFIAEVADLLFHTMVMLGYREVAWSEVEDELARRFGLSGLVEKAQRSQRNSG